MRFQKIKIFLLAGAALLAGSCSKLKKPEALQERENWIASFNDSISIYKMKIDSVNTDLANVNARIGALLNDFEYVKHPRQVTGYYILKGWNSKLPFSKTAVYARINDNESLELIAILQGGNFNRIGVTDGRDEVFSDIVPHDQALNYRQNNINTVCFFGNAADSVAEFIAVHELDKLRLKFINGGSSKQFDIPVDEKKMIATTWELYSEKLYARTLQRNLFIYSKKIDIYRRMLESKESKEVG